MGAAAGLIGGSLLSGALGSRSADRATDAQLGASRDAIAEQRRQFDAILNLLAPNRELGNLATNRLSQLFFGTGVPSLSGATIDNDTGQVLPEFDSGRRFIQGPTITDDPIPGRSRGIVNNQILSGLVNNNPNNPTTRGITPAVPTAPAQQNTLPLVDNGPGSPLDFLTLDPGFNFRLNQGLDQITNRNSALGLTESGTTNEDFESFRQGLASQEFGNAINRLFGLAGLGQTATGGSVNAAANTGNSISNLLTQGGLARAGGIQGRNSAFQDTIGNISLIGLLNSQGGL